MSPQHIQQSKTVHAQPSLFGESHMPPLPRKPSRNAATIRKANGQFLAAKRAGHLWQENVLAALVKFIDGIRSRVSQPIFTFEEFRVYCEANELGDPPHVNAWGSLPSIAARRGMVQWTGSYTKATRAESHGRIIKTWMPAA